MPVSQTFTEGPDTYVVDVEDTYTLHFLGGADTLTVRRGTTTATMGEGNDLVVIRGGAITASGGAGADRFNFYAGASGFELYGDSGDDDFFGYGHVLSGNIYGGAGNDYFVGFSSSVGGLALHGGLGNDIYRHHPGSTATFVELEGEGIDSVQVARGATYTLGDNLERISVSGFSGSDNSAGALTGNALNNTITAHNNVDNLKGLAGDDRLFGKGGDDTIHGGVGNDFLDGGAGADRLNGNDGRDVLNGRDGIDTMSGGPGDDTYYVDDPADIIVENLGEGIDVVRVSVDYTLGANVENAIVSSGSGGAEVLANELDNVLIGSAEADELHGFAGNDVLRGGAGNDLLYGWGGNDIFVGGLGGDYLGGWENGAPGADTFLYTRIEDSTPGLVTSDHIYIEQADRVDLSAIDAEPSSPGNQAFTVVDSYSGQAGELIIGTWDYEDDTDFGQHTYATIEADLDGDGASDFLIRTYEENLSIIPDLLIL